MDRPGSASLWTEVEKDVSCQCRSLAPSAYRYEWDDVKDEDKLEALREATEVASRLAPWVPECQLSTERRLLAPLAHRQHWDNVTARAKVEALTRAADEATPAQVQWAPRLEEV